jgi:NAD kinase
MNVQIVSRHDHAVAETIQQHYPELTIVDNQPDVLLCVGGDGALLYAERMWPGIPKAMVRTTGFDSTVLEQWKLAVLDALRDNTYRLTTHPKLTVTVNNKMQTAVNDIMITRAAPQTALRFQCSIDGSRLTDRAILADGLVVSTAFGSTAYFQSITRTNFRQGVGIAWQYPINPVPHMITEEGSVITIELERKTALVYTDNNDDIMEAVAPTQIVITPSSESLQLVQLLVTADQFNVQFGWRRKPLPVHAL